MSAFIPRVLALCAATLAILVSCSSSTLSGPPTLRVGRDECAACGMIINEARSACSILIESGGRREHLLFDDIGCMLDHERDGHIDATVCERHVRDYSSQAWIAAHTASYLMADSKLLLTPMGSGIASFADRADAASLQSSKPGRVLTWTELVPARQAWMEERYGKPSRPGG